MDLYVQSVGASRVDRTKGQWVPAHTTWMEFGEGRSDDPLIRIGQYRAEQMYPTLKGWGHHTCRVKRVGVEWMYSIMMSETYGMPQVYGCSLSGAHRLTMTAAVREGQPLQLIHLPCLILAHSDQEAHRLGLQQTTAWWPKEQGLVAWGAKAWHIEAGWFRRQVEDVQSWGIMSLSRMKEAPYYAPTY